MSRELNRQMWDIDICDDPEMEWWTSKSFEEVIEEVEEIASRYYSGSGWVHAEEIENDYNGTAKQELKELKSVIKHMKKVLKKVKGQWGRRKNTIRIARQAMEKAMQYAYRDRRNKKRDFKSLWIQRINAGVRSEGITYSKFINGLSKTGIKLDRKILAEIAYDNPEAFKTIVKRAQAALN